MTTARYFFAPRFSYHLRFPVALPINTMWLAKAVEERSPVLAIGLKVDPLWRRLRPDPRFTDLLRRMNLAP